MKRFAIWRLRRELRRLGEAYWNADSKDESIVASYVAGLAQLRSATGTGTAREPALHLGSGGHRLDGWINADLVPGTDTDAVLDIRSGFPFRSGELRWIHSEDVLEHLDQEDGRSTAFCTTASRSSDSFDRRDSRCDSFPSDGRGTGSCGTSICGISA